MTTSYDHFELKQNEAPETWSILFDTSRELLVDDSDNPPNLHDSWLDQREIEARNRSRRLSARLWPQPYLPPPNSSSQQEETKDTPDNVVERERKIILVTDSVQTSLTTQRNLTVTSCDDRSVCFEDTADSTQSPDPADAMPSLEEYLERKAPELAENNSLSRLQSSLLSPWRPRTRKFTGTERVQNKQIFNNDWE